MDDDWDQEDVIPLCLVGKVTVERCCTRTNQLLWRRNHGKCRLEFVTGEKTMGIQPITKPGNQIVMPVTGGLKLATKNILDGKMMLWHKPTNLRMSIAKADPELLGRLHVALLAKRQLRFNGRVASSSPAQRAAMANHEQRMQRIQDRRLFAPVERGLTAVLEAASKQAAAGAGAGAFGGASRSLHGVRRDAEPIEAGVQKPDLPLTQEQSRVMKLVSAGKSLFFTGAAGCGKSTTLRRVLKSLPPRGDIAVTASTATAACILGGVTIHAWAGMGRIEEKTAGEWVEELRRRRQAVARWRSVRVLVVDEISMISAKQMDILEEVARRVRGNGEPFGGIQLVLTGDFFQLPPVSHRGRPAAGFCFQAKSWQRCIGESTVLLTKVFRQSEAALVEVLNKARWGLADEQVVSVLQNRFGATIPAEAEGLKPTLLSTHRKDVDAVNNRHLEDLPGDRVTIVADDYSRVHQGRGHNAAATVAGVRHLDMSTKARKELVLKVGAQVMLVKTISAERGLVNGTRGVVTNFSGKANSPTVQFANGVTERLLKVPFETRTAGGAVHARHQVPLDLAWALSIHKSQGQTLDMVELSLANVFEAGQAYVALSRCRDLAGLRLREPFEPTYLRAHPAVVRFYHQLEQRQGCLSEAAELAMNQLLQKQATAPPAPAPASGVAAKPPARKVVTAIRRCADPAAGGGGSGHSAATAVSTAEAERVVAALGSPPRSPRGRPAIKALRPPSTGGKDGSSGGAKSKQRLQQSESEGAEPGTEVARNLVSFGL